MLRARTGAAGHAGAGGRAQVDCRGVLPNLEGADRPGRTPSPHVEGVVPLDNPGAARPRLPRDRDGHRPRQPAPERADSVDTQRNTPSLQRIGTHSGHRHPARPPLLTLAQATPISSPASPLPAPITPGTMKITIYDWSTSTKPTPRTPQPVQNRQFAH